MLPWVWDTCGRASLGVRVYGSSRWGLTFGRLLQRRTCTTSELGPVGTQGAGVSATVGVCTRVCVPSRRGAYM